MPQIRSRFIEVLEGAPYIALNRDKYHYSAIKSAIGETDTAGVYKRNNLLLDGVIAFARDLYEGNDITSWLSNDEISNKYVTFDDNYILNRLCTIYSVEGGGAAGAARGPAGAGGGGGEGAG